MVRLDNDWQEKAELDLNGVDGSIPHASSKVFDICWYDVIDEQQRGPPILFALEKIACFMPRNSVLKEVDHGVECYHHNAERGQVSKYP